MFIKIPSIAHLGLSSIKVDVETNVSMRGLPYFEIVGLPTKAIDESKDRIKAALSNSKIGFPSCRIIINLAPADIPKEGSCYDLPIAIGILASILKINLPPKSLFFGELSLDGSLRHTKGSLLLALFAQENGYENIFIPSESANEASIVENINVYPIKNLSQLISFLSNKEKIEKAKHRPKKELIFPEFDMKEIIGQKVAKRAIEIAACGGHNFFMIGGPGSGKTMLAKAMPGILPPLTKKESLEVTKIYSISGNLPPQSSLIEERPFRSPHHTISSIGLTGGGLKPKPGEITLAHRGVLFLDEFNEFQRSTLEALRQPMEDGYVSISRSRERVVYPSKYMLVASANPCPCGFLNHKKRFCRCSEREIEKYRKKISGPILDRIDIHIEMPDLETSDFASREEKEKNELSSAQLKERVQKVREIQRKRFLNEDIITNSEMKNKHIKKYAHLDYSAEKILLNASSSFSLSARSYFKTIKTARTIADWFNSREIKSEHISEALQFRPKEKLNNEQY